MKDKLSGDIINNIIVTLQYQVLSYLDNSTRLIEFGVVVARHDHEVVVLLMHIGVVALLTVEK